MPQSELDRVVLDRLAGVVRRRTGLSITDRNSAELERVFRRQLERTAFLPEDYLNGLDGPDGASELELILRELTIGETYFFRGPIFPALEKDLLPELINLRVRDGSQTLRVLSAGCATGEEAYSLAMSLAKTVPEFDSWRVVVVGLDVNTSFLETAAAASYGEWSLRDVSEITRTRCFVESGARLSPRPELRRLVRFQYANLAVDPLPAPELGLVGFDIIVCQNVLLYFDPEIRARVREKLARCLAVGGWLLFGPTDIGDGKIPGCRTRWIGELTAFMREGPFRRRSSSNIPAMRAGEPVPVMPPPPKLPEEAQPSSAPISASGVLTLANDGDLWGAVEAVERLIASSREDAKLHALHGFLLAEVGELDPALDAFRRAVYLDSDSLLAHAGAALTARRLGRDELIRRFEARLRAVAARHPEHQDVAGWKGMTTTRLLQLFGAPP